MSAQKHRKQMVVRKHIPCAERLACPDDDNPPFEDILGACTPTELQEVIGYAQGELQFLGHVFVGYIVEFFSQQFFHLHLFHLFLHGRFGFYFLHLLVLLLGL